MGVTTARSSLSGSSTEEYSDIAVPPAHFDVLLGGVQGADRGRQHLHLPLEAGCSEGETLTEALHGLVEVSDGSGPVLAHQHPATFTSRINAAKVLIIMATCRT